MSVTKSTKTTRSPKLPGEPKAKRWRMGVSLTTEQRDQLRKSAASGYRSPQMELQRILDAAIEQHYGGIPQAYRDGKAERALQDAPEPVELIQAAPDSDD